MSTNIVILIILAIAVGTDLWARKIPNVLTVPAAVGGLVFHLATTGLPGLKSSALGLSVGLGVLLVPYMLGGMGGGDVKLLAGLGAWLGPKNILIATVYSGLAGGVLALGMIVASGGKGANFMKTIYEDLVCFITFRGRYPLASRDKPHMPYSLAIAAGTLGFVIWGSPL
ncbi:MAG: prepilin peptidase [Nitrospinae bacterium]|nr:prepilin peptidase [Nitrospinota bacterium]